MASTSAQEGDALSEQQCEEVKILLWGSDIRHEVFRRWTQGFAFSEDEPSALVQHEGGPCAVIAPVQSFVLKNLLFSKSISPNWRTISVEDQDTLLGNSIEDIIVQVASEPRYSLVTYQEKSPSDAETSQTQDGSKEEGTSSPKKQCFSNEQFHSGLRCRTCESREQLRDQIKHSLTSFKRDYGVLLMLYSAVLTKGLEQIKNEVEDPGEALIDGTYGHGSQSLINLLLTGKAISNVWDNEKEVSGLKLQGITEQSQIGFLTLLEHLRYCEVGWYLKNPHYPIWLLGSETHLTVLFSTEESIVTTESTNQTARRLFGSFDKESCGFILAEVLGDLMAALDLVSDPEYVKIMREKLDPEQLGIVTLNNFMEEFYPSDPQPDAVQSFPLFHYNGLQRSCPGNKVAYQEGNAMIMELPELQIITDSSPIKTCLMTKWPTIELKWKTDSIPSLN